LTARGNRARDGDVPDISYPGVYVEELPWGVRSIAGVETSTTAFIGRTYEGPSEPVCISAFSEYERLFGSPDRENELGHAVRAFFDNGGVRAWVVRVDRSDPLSVGLDALDGPASDSLADGVKVSLYAALGWRPERSDPKRFVAALNESFQPREVEGHTDWVWRPREEPGLLCLPGETDPEILRRALEVADRRGMFLIADAMELDPGVAAKQARDLAGEDSATNGAVYWPPLRVIETGGSPRLVAPSGAVCGIFARVDRARGIWKAPAGEGAEVLGSEGPAVEVREAEVAALADARVNAIRAFPGRGIRVWGARTLSADTDWKYVNIRRTFAFLEHSIDRGLQWTAFESNDEPLWARVRVAVGMFLADLWQRGAFQGRTPQEAFLVRCDRTTMTEDDLAQGTLRVVIGFAPLEPAEFVIIEICKARRASATEIVGVSTGEAGFELPLPHRWVDPAPVSVMVDGPEGWTTWTAVPDFANSGPDDGHFAVKVGEDGRAAIQFGDGEHGAVPMKGASILASYRYGLGRAGNSAHDADEDPINRSGRAPLR
jgi:Bacteriophage tail sheath protein